MRGRPEGVTELGFKGKTDKGTCETFPRVFPFLRSGHVNDQKIIKDNNLSRIKKKIIFYLG